MRSDSSICPVCQQEEVSDSELRMHLHVDHRKSDLVEAIIDDYSERDRDTIPA